MATNAEPAVDDSKTVTEDDLRNDKLSAEVEASKETDETAKDETSEESEETGEEDGQTADPAEDEETPEESKPEFVKQVPSIAGDTAEEYLENLETAYQQSTAEALRLRGLTDTAKTAEETTETEEIDLSDPLRLYAKQQMDKDIRTAFQSFSKDYPQVSDQAEYNKFTVEVATLSNTIMTSQKRLASPEELYSKAAVILGWTKGSSPDSKEKLDMALKDKGATSKTTSATTTVPKSKVTDEMVRVNKLMYPTKSEADIRKELEPFVK